MWGCSTLFHFSQLMLFNISGDIHLLRVKSDLPLSTPVSVDYGLKDWCTGNVNLRFYDGTHESFLQQDDGESVARDIMEIVRESSCWICLQANVWQCIVLIYGHWIYSWRFFLLKINWSVKALFCFKFEIVYFFFHLFGVYRPTLEFFTHMEMSPLPPWPVKILTYTRHSWPLSSESLTCHTYCDTVLLFIMVISEDPWHSHLLPSVVELALLGLSQPGIQLDLLHVRCTLYHYATAVIWNCRLRGVFH